MSGTSRFFTLLTATSSPVCILHRPCCFLHRPSVIFARRLAAAPRRLALYSPPHFSSPLTPIATSQQQFHSQALPVNSNNALSSSPSTAHPWPEWCNLINALSASGRAEEEHGVIHEEDAFVAYQQLPDDFVRAATACLAFARERPNLLRSLSRRDIEVVVSNGTPFLFRTALETARRMRAFLGIDGNQASDHSEVQTIDIMKYILSYASNLAGSPGRNTLYSRELLETSIRNLLHELFELSWGTPVSVLPPPGVDQFPSRSGQTPRPAGQDIVMKRGDWICSKCNFMNFARNIKCLECEEARPRRQLTGGEWECPKCDFFNYGRNVVCLRCDTKRPAEASFNTVNNSSGNGYSGGYAYKTETDKRLAENEEKAQRWFSKINDASGINTMAADEDFPEIMPLRKGENKFVVSTRKTPLERRLSNFQYKGNSVNDGFPEDKSSRTGGADKTLDSAISQSLDRILGGSSSTPDKIATELNAEIETNTSGKNFVPLPADMFATREQLQDTEYKTVGHESLSSEGELQTGSPTSSNELEKSLENTTDSQDKEKEQAEKSEGWFRKMAELHDVKDSPSAISDDDFPEIMPMRKGENRFVVSKKKDRSLTSPVYKRQVAMEQATSKGFVPFVPFPPGYFARKDSPDGSGSPQTPTSEAPSSSTQSDVAKSPSQPIDNPSIDSAAVDRSPDKLDRDLGGSKYTAKDNTSQSSVLSRGSPQVRENQNLRSGWTGKSLEGSAVKEPDPLDMSEEAKTERWFRRVAQIKDISELSQIPDEDFPSIMPMRKGVNRFVVSKRKTPLERRLTSTQYKRNIPVVSSDPMKNENDETETKQV
nr:zinc finger protein VAR3, chloroplastic [Ipomoea batatas]